jgi:hypothetical protein
MGFGELKVKLKGEFQIRAMRKHGPN